METKSITIRTTTNPKGEVSATYNGNFITVEELTNLTKKYKDAGFEVVLIVEPISPTLK